MTYKCQLTDEKCAAQVSAYSPLLPVVEYEDVRFQGSFRDKNQYKGQPSPQLDAAWDRITYGISRRLHS
ncbi:uncharacterized protein N7479_009657 [Penicillium vulpinum]|uniref:uncharacterized protein n=1 Tax=Penicillium vulpinum TaxID=29845 RepID=UPI0025473FFD|nr:uncharacterized protein N7479_009657 [Penicillium vulpinum]KAJ5951244.1 hypothetical protein N7479_009657 [Penicillium vulpinum]